MALSHKVGEKQNAKCDKSTIQHKLKVLHLQHGLHTTNFNTMKLILTITLIATK
jgi:hypothetical protein